MTITVRSLAAAICWLIGFTLATLDTFVAYSLTALAVGFMSVGATLSIHGRVDDCADSWSRAYEIGAEERVRKIR